MQLDDPLHFQQVAAAWPVLQTRARQATASHRAMMPPPVHSGTFVSAAAMTHPCHAVGGDFYDYLDTGREFHLLLGDACGKGTSAALQAALAQGILAVDVQAASGPARVVAHLNEMLCRRRMAQRFVTLFYGVMRSDRRFSYCNAGHCWPMLLKQSSVRRLSVGGVPAGLFCDTSYEEESVRMEQGDVLVVFSDGIPEAETYVQPPGEKRQPLEFGEQRILDVVMTNRHRSPSTLVAHLMNNVHTFMQGNRRRDDMTALVVRYLR